MISLAWALLAHPAQLPSPWEGELAKALESAGLSRESARFDEGVMRIFRRGEHPSPAYLTFSENPWRIPIWNEAMRSQLVQAAGRPSDLLAAGSWAGWGVRRTLLGNPNAPEEEAAKKPGALADLLEAWRRKGWVEGKVPSLRTVPDSAQEAAALILKTVERVEPLRNEAFARWGSLADAWKSLQDPSFSPLALRRTCELGPLAAASHDFFLAVQKGADLAAAVPRESSYDWSVKTKWGVIRLTGGSNSTHQGEEGILLAIDTGGSDRWIAGGALTQPSQPFSAVIDTDGDDFHLSHPALEKSPVARWALRKSAPGWGPASALMGASAVVDVKGNDLYRSHRPGLGSGRFGFAMLLDKEGRDRYDAYENGQGYGEAGAGILSDLAGDDLYEGFQQVQGMGQTLGLGLLFDRTGDDRYIANEEVIDFPSPQSAQHNVSMAQGAGNGSRADYVDGRSQAGGVGILLDQEGNDSYSCGVFGQGVGYWMSVGCLWDMAGDDQYLGQWYVQGASAHFAVGVLEDLGGDDRYRALMNMAQGAGHDLGVGYLGDILGDDSYEAPNLSLGAGNANGIGWMMDLAGSDRYQSSGLTLGKTSENAAGSMRHKSLTLGVFMDLGGVDSFPAAAEWARAGVPSVSRATAWPDARESSLGVFWVRPRGGQVGEGQSGR